MFFILFVFRTVETIFVFSNFFHLEMFSFSFIFDVLSLLPLVVLFYISHAIIFFIMFPFYLFWIICSQVIYMVVQVFAYFNCSSFLISVFQSYFFLVPFAVSFSIPLWMRMSEFFYPLGHASQGDSQPASPPLFDSVYFGSGLKSSDLESFPKLSNKPLTWLYWLYWYHYQDGDFDELRRKTVFEHNFWFSKFFDFSSFSLYEGRQYRKPVSVDSIWFRGVARQLPDTLWRPDSTYYWYFFDYNYSWFGNIWYSMEFLSPIEPGFVDRTWWLRRYYESLDFLYTLRYLQVNDMERLEDPILDDVAYYGKTISRYSRFLDKSNYSRFPGSGDILNVQHARSGHFFPYSNWASNFIDPGTRSRFFFEDIPDEAPEPSAYQYPLRPKNPHPFILKFNYYQGGHFWPLDSKFNYFKIGWRPSFWNPLYVKPDQSKQAVVAPAHKLYYYHVPFEQNVNKPIRLRQVPFWKDYKFFYPTHRLCLVLFHPAFQCFSSRSNSCILVF